MTQDERVDRSLIVFEGVTKRYGAYLALDDVTLRIERGELFVVIGRSGSGKTTLLRTVNAMVRPDSGRVLVDGRDLIDVDVVALRRHMGYVIQDGGLFPHLTAAENISIVGRALGDAWQRRIERAQELLSLLGLDPDRFASRYPGQLSGGQRQRVGLARALYADPAILLMDEPFAALDPITRMEMQDEFARLSRTLRKTIVFVTHDIDEALTLGDRIAVFDGGRLIQVDAPSPLIAAPATAEIARFLSRRAALERR